MKVKVFIDGSSGTTGLRIADRLAARPEIELLSISAEGRKDVNERAKVINSADLAFLCLPDAASREVMPLLRPDVKVLDTSTAFRTDAAWDYGFPELKGQKEKIKHSCRVAVPGCYASGFISIARPLVELGLVPADYPFSCTGISGYSGGGKKMIAEYENAARPAHRLSQGQIGAVSAPICAICRRSLGGFSIVSVQPCPLFSDSGSKLGQAQSSRIPLTSRVELIYIERGSPGRKLFGLFSYSPKLRLSCSQVLWYDLNTKIEQQTGI